MKWAKFALLAVAVGAFSWWLGGKAADAIYASTKQAVERAVERELERQELAQCRAARKAP